MKIDKYFEILNDMSFDNYIKSDGCHRHNCVMLNRKEFKNNNFRLTHYIIMLNTNYIHYWSLFPFSAIDFHLNTLSNNYMKLT